ncbi:hypothetical protein BDM02DRAFT_3125777 [Thelephora ganbajun]|uniref:Uncharacterized protein n=1 Tax=Thelephora ganbajun TaxID=370292 RepID=A0ACB6ZUY8_THEGA|nr:hypothetical protein BDM02DRAFT_3125777 [Thelephora ganbajun]
MRTIQRRLTSNFQVIPVKQSEAIIPDIKMRENAINFLLGVGLPKMLKGNQGTVSFRAVAKNETNATKDLDGEESLVLGHIKATGNEGIWTKHLKGKTDLHQTIIDSLPEYQNAQNVLQFLKQTKITETPLSVEHVESLLNVPVLDGEIERIPAYGASLWDSKAIVDDPVSESERHSKSKRKHRPGEDGDGHKKNKSSKRQDSDTELDDASSPPRGKKSRRSKRQDSDSDRGPKRKLQKPKARDKDSQEDKTEERKKRQFLSMSKKSKSREQSEDEPTTASSDSGMNGPEVLLPSQLKSNASKSAKRSSSPAPFKEYEYESTGTTHVYRAIRPERAVSGWSQAPCTACPGFDFCDDRGPVNARDCVYYGPTLAHPRTAKELLMGDLGDSRARRPTRQFLVQTDREGALSTFVA